MSHEGCDHKFVDSEHCLVCGWVPPKIPITKTAQRTSAIALQLEACPSCIALRQQLAEAQTIMASELAEASIERERLRQQLVQAQQAERILAEALNVGEGETPQDVIAMAVRVMERPHGARLLAHCIAQGKRVDEAKARAEAAESRLREADAALAQMREKEQNRGQAD